MRKDENTKDKDNKNEEPLLYYIMILINQRGIHLRKI